MPMEWARARLSCFRGAAKVPSSDNIRESLELEHSKNIDTPANIRKQPPVSDVELYVQSLRFKP